MQEHLLVTISAETEENLKEIERLIKDGKTNIPSESIFGENFLASIDEIKFISQIGKWNIGKFEDNLLKVWNGSGWTTNFEDAQRFEEKELDTELLSIKENLIFSFEFQESK